MAEIRAARPVRSRWVSPAEFASLAIRSRGLPAGHRGDVRLVEIAGIDVNTCGGTHVASTAELETVVLLGTEPMRGGTRLYFAAGGRVRRLLHQHLQLAAELRSLLGAPNHEVAAVVRAKLEALRLAERTAQRLAEESAQTLGAALAAFSQPFTCHQLEGKEMPFLQRVARSFAQHAPAAVLLLTSEVPGGALFCLTAGPRAAADPACLAQVYATAVGGRAGGSGRLFQGKTPAGVCLEAGIAAVKELLSLSPRGSRQPSPGTNASESSP